MDNELNRLSNILEENLEKNGIVPPFDEMDDLSYFLSKNFLEYREFKAMCTLNPFTESGKVELSDAEIMELYKFTKQTYKTEE